MLNLSVREKIKISCPCFKDCQTAAVEGKAVYFVSQSELCKVDLDKLDAENNVEVLVPLDLGSVLDLKYLPEEDCLVIVSRLGSVAIFDLNSSMLDVVGDVSGGINAACWSPDMETLVLVSGTGNVLLMSRTWDVLQEIPLFQKDYGEAKLVSVGWGSKETQFHGSEGKEARTKREIQSVLASWDDQMTRITWRADGLFFAINSVEPNHSYRAIRVFNREGQLQSTSEPVGQLEQSLSWKSSGASGLITSTITLIEQGKQQVAFFEKNGLRHGEFDIAVGHEVLDTYWNGDSTVLATLVRCTEDDYVVQLWTVSNYYWYIKHLIRYKTNSRPLWMAWDVVETHRLHIITADGVFCSTVFGCAVNGSMGLSSADPTCVAVIDNRKLKLTFLREAVIPPPMCGWEVDFPDAVHSVDFMSSDSNKMCVTTHGGLAYIFQLAASDKESGAMENVKITRKEGRFLRPSLISSYQLGVSNWADFYHWRWLNSSILLACCVDQLMVLEIQGDSIKSSAKLPLEYRIGGLLTPRDQSTIALVHLTNGKTLQLSVDGMKVSSSIIFPEYCIQLDLVGDRLIGLAASGRLYVDGREIASAVSSFAIHSDFLVLTSLQKHQLLCLPLTALSSSFAVTERAIERGAKIVHAVASSTSVVLQMPRGNLEAIHPRALSLNVIKSLIDKRCYGEAFDLMKKQRINLNLFFDHEPQEFLVHCDEFIVQISCKDIANVNLFLSELQDEDYTATMYQSHYQGRSSSPWEGKIDTVCLKLRQVMEDMDPKKYLIPILTSMIKQGMLPSALKRVQSLSEESTKDQALKYMAILVDGEHLYKEALATYDLQLTLMVAHRSQKDPKEYLAFLNELNAMADEEERRFTIDNSLKRYESAVRHLCRCRPVRTDQIVNYMKLHRVYAAVVEELVTCPDDVTVALQTAACLLADTMMSRENHEEAGYLYQRVGLYQQALDSFKLCGLWSNCLALASRLEMSQSELDELVKRLVPILRTKKRHADAAHLAEHYLKDYVLGGRCLIEGSLFSEAWSLSCRYQLKDFAENILKTELSEAYEAMHSKLASIEEECCKYSARLSVVRRELLHKKDHPPLGDTDHADLYSETGSSVFTHTTGVSSGRTSTSSKNRRKHERKKLRLKEGNPLEDMAIINHLHILYSSVNAVLVEVGHLLRGALLISKDWDQARLLQNRTESLLKMMEEKKKTIWDFAFINKNQNAEPNFGPAATTDMVISQVNKEKEEFFATRYLELDAVVRRPPDSPDHSWKVDALK